MSFVVKFGEVSLYGRSHPSAGVASVSDSPSRLKGAHALYKDKDFRWWRGFIHTVGSARESFVVRFFDDLGPVKIVWRPELYTTDVTAARLPGTSNALSR